MSEMTVSIEKRYGKLSQVQENLLEHCAGRKMERFEGGYWHKFGEDFIGARNNKFPKRYWGTQTIEALIRRGLAEPLKKDKWGNITVVDIKEVE